MTLTYRGEHDFTASIYFPIDTGLTDIVPEFKLNTFLNTKQFIPLYDDIKEVGILFGYPAYENKFLIFKGVDHGEKIVDYERVAIEFDHEGEFVNPNKIKSIRLKDVDSSQNI